MKPAHLFIDQYGQKIWARGRMDLKEKAGPGKVSIMYVDKKDGQTVRCGYVVGQRWFSEFAPVERPA